MLYSADTKLLTVNEDENANANDRPNECKNSNASDRQKEGENSNASDKENEGENSIEIDEGNEDEIVDESEQKEKNSAMTPHFSRHRVDLDESSSEETDDQIKSNTCRRGNKRGNCKYTPFLSSSS